MEEASRRGEERAQVIHRVFEFLTQGLRRTPGPFFVSALLVLAATPAKSQDPVRPWLDWRTLATTNYRLHYPRELEEWARDVAARVENVDSAIVALVGFAPPRPVHVVIDDPSAEWALGRAREAGERTLGHELLAD